MSLPQSLTDKKCIFSLWIKKNGEGNEPRISKPVLIAEDLITVLGKSYKIASLEKNVTDLVSLLICVPSHCKCVF